MEEEDLVISKVPNTILNKVVSAFSNGLSRQQMFWYCQIPEEYFAAVDAYWNYLHKQDSENPDFTPDTSHEA